MIRCPESLDVEETDGLITITCNRSSALSLQSVVSVISEDGTAIGKLVRVLLYCTAFESLRVRNKTKMHMTIGKKVFKITVG